MSKNPHSINIRIYYEDTDAGGVVYHANYFKFTERARTEFLRIHGFECSALEQNKNTIFVVRHIDADYIKPLVLDDEVQVTTRPHKVGNASFVLAQDISKKGDVVFKSLVTLVSIDTATMRPKPLPSDIATLLRNTI